METGHWEDGILKPERLGAVDVDDPRKEDLRKDLVCMLCAYDPGKKKGKEEKRCLKYAQAGRLKEHVPTSI